MPKKKIDQPEINTETTEVAAQPVEDIKKAKAKEKKVKAVKQAKQKAELADKPLEEPTEETAENFDLPELANTSTEEAPAEKAEVKKVRVRGKKYADARSQVDKTKQYSVEDAIELIKHMSYSKFVGSVEAHLQLKEAGATANITFPHTTGKSVKVAIFDEALLTDLNKGVTNFDVLLAKPADMKNLTKFARVLGPKGLMPNPKNGTLTANPEAKKKELEAGAVTLKTEKKAPLVHTLIGKINMPTTELAENVRALLKAFTGKTVKLYICASMSPSVRVTIEK